MSPRPLPRGLTPYRRTDVFTADTVPIALQRAHSTKVDVWGLIQVVEGRLVYRICDERRPAWETVLEPGVPGVVEPTILHEVAPVGPVRFFVEFHRREAPA